jgi:hypothetical protein
MNRWYNQHPNLEKSLDAFKDMEHKTRDPIVKGIMELVQQDDPSLLHCENAFDFPLDFKGRRWYDSDPYLWLMVNTLKIADDRLLQSVDDYLGKVLVNNKSLV